MKKSAKLLLGLVSALVIAPLGMAEEKPARMADIGSVIIDEEYQKTKGELTGVFRETKKRLSEIEGQRNRVIAEGVKQAQLEASWIENLKKYETLLTARYVNEKGQAEPSLAVSEKDVENLNRIFESYLRTTPLQGRTSLGQALKALDQGVDRLEALVRIHGDANEKNNSELEILAKQKAELEQRLEKTLELAQKVGFDPSAQADGGARMPASER